MSIQSFLFLLASEEGEEGDTLHADNFESDTRNISLGFTLLTETGDKHLIVFCEVVEAAVPGDEGCDFFSVLFEHDSDSLSDGGVGLFRLYTNFFDDESLGHAAAHEGVLESRTQQSSIVLLIVPPCINIANTFEVSSLLLACAPPGYLLACLNPYKYYYLYLIKKIN